MTAKVVRHTGKHELDLTRVEKMVATLVVGRILRRTDQGKDAADKPFQQYSPTYTAGLRAIGEDPGHVDMRLTGGTLNSIRHQRTEKRGTSLTLFFGPDTGTSAQIRMPPPWIAGNPNALTRWKKRHGGRAQRTGGRSPPHNLLLLWHQEGRGGLPKRKVVGIEQDKEGMRQVRDVITKLGVFRSR